MPRGFDAVVGRSRGATLRIQDPAVSRRHARLVHDEHGVTVVDLGSSNGTRLNGAAITTPTILKDGDVVTFGVVSGVFRESGPAEGRGSDGVLGPLEPEMPVGALPTASSTNRSTAPGPAVSLPDRARGFWRKPSDEFRGVIVNAVQPVINVNPWLIMEIRTDAGEVITVRGWFFWGPLTAPHVAEGHYVRVAGRLTSHGYIKPRYIINESTGSRWPNRWRLFS